jgi:DNA-binding response OmpR family regulator
MKPKKKRILVVDDDADILEVLKIILDSAGYSTASAAKGSDVYKKVKSFKPDLILLDVLLSGEDGRVICRNLKKGSGTKHIPVIMLSAHPEASRTINSYKADGFIEKPFDVDPFLDRIAALF